jgi:hypothetical protein
MAAQPTPFDGLYDRLIAAISLIAAAIEMLEGCPKAPSNALDASLVRDGVPKELAALDAALAAAGVPSKSTALWGEPAPNLAVLYERACEIGLRVQLAMVLSRVPSRGAA